jgi:nucleoid-associated protein YgaU
MTTPTLTVGTLTVPAAKSAMRLTARGRAALLVALVLALAMAAVVLVIGPGTAAPATAPASMAPTAPDAWGAELANRGLAAAHTVAAGDTLWDLATAIDPAGDPRPLIDRIQAMNGLSDGRLSVGDQLWLPVSGG